MATKIETLAAALPAALGEKLQSVTDRSREVTAVVSAVGLPTRCARCGIARASFETMVESVRCRLLRVRRHAPRHRVISARTPRRPSR